MSKINLYRRHKNCSLLLINIVSILTISFSTVAFLSSCSSIIPTATSNWEDNLVDLKFTYIDNAYSVSGYVQSNRTIVQIPDEYDDGTNGTFPVTSIAANAFKDSSLTKLCFGNENNLKRIEDRAFIMTSNLSSLQLPDGLEYVGQRAFYKSGLVSLTVPDSLSYVGESAFENGSLTFNFYKGCNYLGNANNPYRVLMNPTEVLTSTCEIHPDCKVITSCAFELNKVITGVIVPKQVEYICDHAFNYAINLASVDFEDGSQLTTIGQEVFNHCISLTQIALPNDAINLGDGLFNYCSGLKNATLPNKLLLIPDDTFNASGLEDITIPDSVTRIGSQAFRECTKLKSILIPRSVTSMGGFVFGYDDNLTIYCQASLSQSEWQEGWNGGCTVVLDTLNHGLTTDFEYALINDGGESYISIIKYLGSENEVIVPSTIDDVIVKKINEKAFYKMANITAVSIPDSVEEIGESAFYATNIAEIDLPSSLKTLGAYAFFNCGKLTSASVPEGVTSIEDSTFFYCHALTELDLPDSLLSVAEFAFAGCTSLADLVLPSHLTSIGNLAFSGCISLHQMVVPQSVSFIGERAFVGCITLVSLSLPFIGASKVSADGDDYYPLGYLFGKDNYVYSTGCEQTYVKDGVSVSETFYIPQSLKEVIVDGGVISPNVFANCPMINAIRFGVGVNKFASLAFANCTNLKWILLSDGQACFASDAFSNDADFQLVFFAGDKEDYKVTTLSASIAVAYYAEVPPNEVPSDMLWYYDEDNVPTIYEFVY